MIALHTNSSAESHRVSVQRETRARLLVLVLLAGRDSTLPRHVFPRACAAKDATPYETTARHVCEDVLFAP